MHFWIFLAEFVKHHEIHAVFIRFSHQGLDVDPVPQGTVEIPLGSTRAMAWVPRSARAVETFAAAASDATRSKPGRSSPDFRCHKMLVFDVFDG